jgi:hypothetical protein
MRGGIPHQYGIYPIELCQFNDLQFVNLPCWKIHIIPSNRWGFGRNENSQNLPARFLKNAANEGVAGGTR